MKEEMSSVDVYAVTRELQFLVDSKLEKAYQHTADEIRLKLQEFKTGKYDLVIEAGKRLHLTGHPRESPKLPPSFPMILRKYMMGGRVTKIAQHNFDRIVEIEVVRAGVTNTLVAELFNQGNVIMLDADRRIMMPLRSMKMKDRDVLRGEQYEFPPPQLSPLDVTVDSLKKLFEASDRDVVRTLATETSIGGMYAEEALAIAGVDKNKQAKSLVDGEIRLVVNGLNELFEPLKGGNLKPHIVLQDGKEVDVLPIELKRYESYQKVYFESFNKALDEYFSKHVVAEVKAVVAEKKAEKLGVLERRLKQQEEAIAKFEKEEIENARKGELIYAEYAAVDDVIKIIKGARSKGYSWDDIRKTLKDAKKAGNPAATMIQSVDPAANAVAVKFPQATVNISVDLTVPQNAQVYYEKVKKVQSKKEGALKAIEVTRKAMAKEMPRIEVVAELKKAPAKTRPRKPKWYERYRWFYTSDGFLVIAGRDADQNEEVVKKYMDKKDVFFHAQAHGAPITIVKAEGREITPDAIAEVAQFAVSYSSVWKSGQFSGDCYWARPEQVSKTPEPGEYVAKGAFIIRGERNYVKNVEVKAAVGVRLDETGCYIIGGPVAAVKARAKYSVAIEPGEFNQGDIAKKIYRYFLEHASEEDAKAIRQAASPDKVSPFLPPGESRLSKGAWLGE
jgi:predicted ribosome quality control (RQC) complex YloA/Tae2 family protein